MQSSACGMAEARVSHRRLLASRQVRCGSALRQSRYGSHEHCSSLSCAVVRDALFVRRSTTEHVDVSGALWPLGPRSPSERRGARWNRRPGAASGLADTSGFPHLFSRMILGSVIAPIPQQRSPFPVFPADLHSIGREGAEPGPGTLVDSSFGSARALVGATIDRGRGASRDQ